MMTLVAAPTVHPLHQTLLPGKMGTKNSQFGDYHLRQTMTIEIPAKAEIAPEEAKAIMRPHSTQLVVITPYFT